MCAEILHSSGGFEHTSYYVTISVTVDVLYYLHQCLSVMDSHQRGSITTIATHCLIECTEGAIEL